MSGSALGPGHSQFLQLSWFGAGGRVQLGSVPRPSLRLSAGGTQAARFNYPESSLAHCLAFQAQDPQFDFRTSSVGPTLGRGKTRVLNNNLFELAAGPALLRLVAYAETPRLLSDYPAGHGADPPSPSHWLRLRHSGYHRAGLLVLTWTS